MHNLTETFTKLIEMQFTKVGKRTKLVGFTGTLTDESGIVLHSELYDDKQAAETALDALVHELLTDYAERGLVDTLPESIDPIAARLAQHCANLTRVPTHVISQDGHYLIQDEADIDCYGGRAAIVATYQPIACDPPGPNPEDDTEGDSAPPDRPRAVTAQSIAIESKIATCANCQGIHHIQDCPELMRALFTPPATDWKDVDLGRELCKMKWRDFPSFVTLLRTVGAAGHLRSYAASYVAYLETYGPVSLSIGHVLTIWAREMAAQPVAA